MDDPHVVKELAKISSLGITVIEIYNHQVSFFWFVARSWTLGLHSIFFFPSLNIS